MAGCGWELFRGCWMWTPPPPVWVVACCGSSLLADPQWTEGTGVVWRDAGARSPEEFAGQGPESEAGQGGSKWSGGHHSALSLVGAVSTGAQEGLLVGTGG